jgi:hypothetical protein
MRLLASPYMTFLAAAGSVLKWANRPMTCREVTELALGRGLISPTGKTPVATMRAALYAAARADPKSALHRDYQPGPHDGG